MSGDFNRLAGWFRFAEKELGAYKKELQKLREENERLRGLYPDFYEFGPVGYLTLDKKGIIQEINLKGAGLLGAPRGRLLQMPLLICLAKEDRALFLVYLNRIFKDPVGKTCELRVKKKKGNPLWVNLRCMVAEAPDGHLKKARLALFDITNRKRPEESLRQSAKRLQDLDSIRKNPER